MPFGQALESSVDEDREGFLVGLERYERVDALESAIVRGDFVVEMEGALVVVLFEDRDAGVIAGSLDRDGEKGSSLGGERRGDTSRTSYEES